MADVQHRDLPDAERHEPKGISTATSGQVYQADGLGSGTWVNVASNATNTVIVNSESDFPAPSGGVITLADNTLYILGSDITTVNRFVSGSKSKITGGNWLAPTLSYTGTDSMFSGTDASFLIADISLDCPNGKLFNFSDTAGGVQSFEAMSVVVDNCAAWGTFSDLLFVAFVNSSSGNATTGADFSGSNFGAVSLRQFALTSSAAGFVGIDFGTSVHNTVEFRDLLFSAPAGATGISGAAGNANIASGSVATVESGTFTGGLTPLSGITTDDFRWSFRGNTGIRNTKADALLSLSGNTTETVITAVDTPVLVAGTFVVERQSHFTGTTSGRAAYDAEIDIVVPVDISVTLDPAAGTNQSIRTYVAKNGSVIANSGKTILVDAGAPETAVVPWQLDLSTGDFVEIFVENKSSTNNIIVKDAVLRVR